MNYPPETPRYVYVLTGLGALALVLVLSVGLYWALGFRWIRAVVSLGIAVPLSIGLSSVGQDALYYMRTSKKGNDHNE